MASPLAAIGGTLAGGYSGAAGAPLDVVSVPTASIVLQAEWQPSAADIARTSRMQNAIVAYEGRLQPPLKKRTGEATESNVMTNRIRPAVRTATSLLFGKPLKITVDENGPKEAAQPWCDDFAVANRFSTFCKELKHNGALCGSAFWKIVEHQPYPRLVLIDPTTMCVLTDPDDWSVVIAYVQNYQVTRPGDGKLLDRRHIEYRETADAQQWIIIDREREAGTKFWSETRNVTWPYPWSPIHATKNLPSSCEWWGEPDVDDDLIGLNKALNFVQSNTAKIIRMHAHPKPVGHGFDGKSVNWNSDDILVLPGENGEIHYLEMTSDLASSMQFANDIRESMDELSSIPAVALSRLSAMPRGAMSGVTIAMLYQPALNRTEDARELYGPALEETFSHALELDGMGAAIEVHATWQEVLPRDEQADWTVAQQQLECGVSKHQILQDHNLDYDEQAAWLAEEKEDSAANTPAPLLAFNRGLNQPPLPPTSRGAQAQQDGSSQDGSDQTQQGEQSA